MPNNREITEIEEYLETLEDTTLFKKNTRTECWECFTTIFDGNDNVTPIHVQRILTLFVTCMKEDIQSLPHAITAITSLLTNAKVIPSIEVQDLLPSALGLLHLLKTLCLSSGIDTLREISFEAFLSYPVDVLSTLVTYNCSEILEIFTMYKPKASAGRISVSKELCVFLHKFLKILPAAQRKQFVEEGVELWFGELVPSVMNFVEINSSIEQQLPYLECLETLADTLVHVNCFECPQWQIEFMEGICNVQKYPMTMKKLLLNGSTIWHRLWNFFVKVLKNQITCMFQSHGTPINAMLRIVEAAFKMDVPNRKRAFQCWDNLIDNFATESSESCFQKKIKLLFIPLKLNNTKTEETALAKFNTWWKLIMTFQSKLDKFTNDILPFLHFLFGKEVIGIEKKTPAAGVGFLYESMKPLCLQAFVQIVGHENCDCCTDLPNLNGKIINIKSLTTHWGDWMCTFKLAIKLSYKNDKTEGNEVKKAPMHILCIWKAFIITIAELTPNGVRRDMFNGLIQVLIDLTKTCHNLEDLPDIIFSLVLTLFEKDRKVKSLLVTSKDEELPLHKIISIITNTGILEVPFKRYETEKMVQILKPVTNFIVENETADLLLDSLPHNPSSIKLWTALVHSVKDSKSDTCPNLLTKVLLWPLNICEDKYAAMEWYIMYNLNVEIINKPSLEKKILETIMTETNVESKYFKLCLTICLLKDKLVNQEDVGELLEVLKNLTSEMIDYKELEQVFPILVDTITVMLNNLKQLDNTMLAKLGIICVQNILKMAFSEIRSHENEIDNPITANIFIMLNIIFSAIELIYEVPRYSEVNCGFVDFLVKEQALYLSRESSIFKFILTKLELLLLNCSFDIVKNKINDSIEMLRKDQYNINNDICGGTNEIVKEFTSPDVKDVKKAKKKASIVNTVVENGEEYVVVKSNWTFNPKKLTENQKEKFQKKREDIPALYQDLSQSQDEFKLSRWKTDSQDTTSSNSKSATNDDASSILKNIASSDVVPNILENIRSENDKNSASELNMTHVKEVVCHLENDKPNEVDQLALSTPKNTKSPRMALKDRIFRNVKILIEKSVTDKDTTEKTAGGLQIENVPNTPTTKPILNANISNSAPPLLSADRPSRVKRLPKKYDDVKLFGLKKKRNLPIDSFSGSSNDSTETNMLKENQIDKMDTEQNTDKADVNNEINSKSVDLEVITPSPETKENEVFDIDFPTSEVTSVSQLVATTDAPEAEAAEPIGGDLCISQNNSDTEDIPMNDVAQNDQKNESKKETNDNNVTVELNSETENITNETVTLNTPIRKTKEPSQKSTTKKKQKSRIEKELVIDTVEGHPFLQIQSRKRLSRRSNTERESTNRRKSVTEKLNKLKNASKISPKVDKKSKEKGKLTSNSLRSISVTVEETQEKSNLSEDVSTYEDAPYSEDVIESSQDSTLTSISVKSTKRKLKRLPNVKVAIKKIADHSKHKCIETQELLPDSNCEMISLQNNSVNQETTDDIELPQNRSAEVDTNQSELTENMDTEPIADKNFSEVIYVINDDDESPIIINSEMSVGPETQEIAGADTQHNDSADFVKFEFIDTSPINREISNNNLNTTEDIPINKNTSVSAAETLKDAIKTASEPNESLTTGTDKDTDMCSPFKDNAQRKQDFLNNTSEISPIKVQRPNEEKPSPPQEIKSGYLVVKLTSPVQSNGEPFDKCGSPEFFTEDKTSPDKRDHSPPRADVIFNSGSPSSSLSLKKNRPQAMRPVGRAAHMLGLCVPDSLNSINNLDRVEPEDPKKGNTSTPVRRNLRVLYNTVADNSDNLGENEEEQDNFLKFKKILPSTNSSPSVPILKRKLIDIVDDTTASPASKRKRVSFHDPPVSTTVSVQKYIERGCVISPSNASKRSAERQAIRNLTKSPKRLENTFVKLDTVLSKALESFTDEQANSLTNDTNASLDVTPAVTVVNTSELNDTDPICPDLVECKDSIDNIAVELSSPALKDLFIKELEGKVGTVGDLAKMTELEVNRLCIKAPKVQITKKVLEDYINKRVIAQDISETIIIEDDESDYTIEINAKISIPETIILAGDETALATEMDEEMVESEPIIVHGETQTDRVSVCETAMQTSIEAVQMAQTQTNTLCTAHTSMQTEESGFKTTYDLISSCLHEGPDFVEKLAEQLEETSIRKISEKLPTDTIIDILANKSRDSTPKLLFNKILSRYSQNVVNDETKTKELSVLKDFVSERFDSRDLILFCSQLLQTVYDKPA